MSGSGISVKFTESTMRRGCDWCKSYIMAEIEKNHDKIDYICLKCKAHWVLMKDE